MGFKTRNEDRVETLFRPITALRIVKIVEMAEERFVVQELRKHFFGLIKQWCVLIAVQTNKEALDYVEKLRDEVNFTEVTRIYIPE